MYKKAKFLIFCMIFVAGGAFSQSSGKINLSTTGFYTPKSIFQFTNYKDVAWYFHKINNKKKGELIIDHTTTAALPATGCFVIRRDFYTHNFGLFCKKELQLEKASKIPLKFRIGSLQYNDYLEQKPNAVKPF